jgi:hypothetical protein
MTISENAHVSNALDWQHGDVEPSTFALHNAQIEATLAVAYEARTANMLALYKMGGLWRSAVLREELGYAIKARLGASETTDA